jgi:hypothetical protein
MRAQHQHTLLRPHVRPHTQILTEAFHWIRAAVADFLLPAFKVPLLLQWAREGVASTVPATRTAAIALLGTMHAFLGPALEGMVRRGCVCVRGGAHASAAVLPRSRACVSVCLCVCVCVCLRVC